MAKPTSIAVFADCRLTQHQALYRQAGSSIARHGAHLVCVARNGHWPRALVDSALAAGGTVSVMTGQAKLELKLPQGVKVERQETDREAGRRAVEEAGAVIGLPGGIDTVAALYAAWTDAGGAQSGRPVGLLNQNRAYEVVRGFAADVASVGRGNIDPLIQIAESFEDLWSKLMRLV